MKKRITYGVKFVFEIDSESILDSDNVFMNGDIMEDGKRIEIELKLKENMGAKSVHIDTVKSEYIEYNI